MRRVALLFTAGIVLLVGVELVFLLVYADALIGRDEPDAAAPVQVIPVVDQVPPPPTAPAAPDSAPLPSAPELPTLAPAVLVPPPVPAAALPPVNGLPVDAFVVMSPAVRAHVREIYAQGQVLGNNPRMFSKVGDSTLENPFFLTPFDDSDVNLGEYVYLAPAVDYFAGSFTRQSMVVQRGLHAWSVFDPMWAADEACQPDESPIACEIRLYRPSIMLVRLGSNDAGVPELFAESIRGIVEFSLAHGVIPVLGTKADRHADPDNTANETIRQIAAAYRVPLWDYDLVAQTLPDRGLGADEVHMTAFADHDYTRPEAFQHGQTLHNLTALIALDQVWREAMQLTG
jgi:hypothetical protein